MTNLLKSSPENRSSEYYETRLGDKVTEQNIFGENEKPAFGAGEWAKFRLNICKGCENNCKYCYARADSARRKQIPAAEWSNVLTKEKYVKKGYRKRDGLMMFPSTHDITVNNYEDYITVLEKLVKSGNDVLIVTKPTFVCVKAICDKFTQYIDQLLFRFTIGSIDNSVLRFWEPQAPTLEERLESLKYAYLSGYNTSISIEPFLDAKVEELVEILRPYTTESIWIGEANELIERIDRNGELDEETNIAANNLLTLYSSGYEDQLYKRYKKDPLIKWKESLKIKFGIAIPTVQGLNI